jgi:autotransporter-associated beta strand protein
MKTILLDLKTRSKTLLVFALFFIVSIAQGATRYSVASGNWNSTSTWSTTSGGAAGASVPVAGDTVIIEKGFNVTVTADAACGTITFTTTTATSLTINSGFTLTVSGAITIPRTTTGENLIAVGDGTLNAGSIAFTSGGSTVNHEITIATGTVVVTGNITTNSTGISASITFTGAGLLRVGGQLMSSGTVGGTLTTVPGSTVDYYGAAQTAKVATYYNLTVSGSGAKTFATTPTVNGILSLEGTATIVATSGVVTYGSAATLQYNTSTARTATSEEWISSFSATGGIIIKNTGTITLNANKSFSSSPLTVKSGATLALSTFTLSSPSSLTLENGTSGSAITGTGTLTLGGNVTVNYTGSGSNPATITCPIALASNRSFTVANDGSSASDLTISGIISNAFTLTKLGAGTLTLSAANTYSGSTTVSAGTLNVTGSLSSSTAVSVASGAVLSGSGTAAGSIALSGNVSPGATANNIETLTTGAFTFSGGSSYTFDISNVTGTAGTNWDLLTSTGSITVSSNSGSPTTIYLIGNPTGFSSCSSYTWKIAGGTSVTSFAASDFVINTASFTPSFSGIFTITNTGNDLNLVYTSTSEAGSASSTPTLCVNTVLTAITHTTTGASGIGTATGLPAGVTAAWASNTITISGTPTAAGTFNYSIPLIGGCTSTPATGTITVTGNKSVTAASSTPTLCIDSELTPITHTTTGATGISTATGLPAGVTAAWASNTITISGTPTASGTFNYSIPLSGGCGSASATGTIVVTPNLAAGAASSTPTVCINTALTAITHSTTGATGIGTATGLPAGVTAAWATNTITISGTPTASGTFNYSIPLTGNCSAANATGTITVNPYKTATLSSAVGTNAQTVCINNAITSITYTTTGATGIGTASNLPTGVTASWASNVLTISGTPSASGTFNYSIPLSGGCGSLSVTGTITVKANNTITLTSSSSTTAQSKCVNTSITTITYSTVSATGATFSGLPAGVTGVWASNVVTISGTPTVSSVTPYTYTVTLTGGCGSTTVTASGTITVKGNKTATLTSAAGTNNQSACKNVAITPIKYATTGATGKGTSQGLPSGVTATWASNVLTISGTPTNTGTYNYSIPLSGGCGTLSVTGTITVKSTGTITLTSAAGTNAQTKCINTAITTIKYSTTGATGATITGLPTGVTGSWASNVVTISGTPTVSSAIAYTYVVSLTGVCGSATGTIKVNSTLNAGAIATTGQTVCYGSVPSTIGSSTDASGGDGTITYKWQANGVDIANSNSSTYTPAAVVSNTTFTRFAKDGTCNTTFIQSSGSYVVTVQAIPTEGAISGAQTICSDATPATITSTTAGTASGTLSYRWESNTNLATPSWTTIAGATGATYTPSLLASTTQFRRITMSTTNGVTCESTPTTAVQVTVNTAVSVQLDNISDIAIGASSFTIPFVSTTGNPNQYSVTAVPYMMNGFNNIVNQTLGTSPIVVNTPTTTTAGVYNFQFMVRNSANGCQSGPYDFDIMVTGVSHGSIGSNQTICNGATPSTLTNTASATTSTGTISYTWQKSTVTINAGYVDIPGATSATYAPGPLTQTTYFKRIASNGLGDSSATNSVTITVRDAFNAGMIATSGESVCYNGNPSLVGPVTAATGGDNSISYKWQANGVNINSNTATYDPPTGLTATTTYVRLAKDNTCNTSYTPSTGSWVVTVNPVSIGGTVNGPSTACAAGTVGKVLTLTGNTGTVVRWESSVSPFTAWTAIANTSTTYTTDPITETKKFRAVVQSGACSQAYSDVITITLYTDSTTYVDGAWTNGEPDATKTATISSSYATAGTNVTACALVVNNSASVVVSTGDTLTLTEGLTVESGSLMTLNNDANLIQSGPTNLNTGAIKVKRTSSALRRQDYTLWSSPVAEQKLLPFSSLTLVNRFYTYNTSTNLYDMVASPSTTNFEAAKGYLIRVPNNHPTTPTTWTGTFTGVPNSGNYSMPIVYGGGNLRFNLVGNPYPSPINAVSFVNNATNYNSISGTLYFWRKTNNAAKPSYCTWTLGGFVTNGEAQVYDPNDVIQTGQGFFVEATGQGSTVEFDNSMRQENHSDQFFRTMNVIEKNRIWLNLTNSAGLFSQAMVGYITHATAGLDPAIDGKFINDGEIALTSLIDGAPYAIQGRGLPFHSSDVVPLNLKVTNAGSYTIAIDRVDGLFTNSEDIFLKDNLTGVVHNLRTSAYDFTSDAGTFDTRFEIVYIMPTTATGKHEFNANQIVLYKDLNNSLVVNTGSEKMTAVKVFDIQGRLLLEQNNIDATQTTLNINGSNEVILVQITTENGAVVTKKYIMQRMTSKEEKLSMQKVQLAEDE